MHEKILLRAELMARRSQVFAEVVDAGERLVANFPASIRVTDRDVIAGFIPFRTEIDCLPLVRFLGARGGQIALPRIVSLTGEAREQALTFYLCNIDEPKNFQPNKMGLREPYAYLPRTVPAIVLVPLLGFDRRGYRIGYGKGYYDDALTRLRADHDIIAIGVAFAAQEVPEIPTQSHDQRLDWIITENEAYRFPS